MRPVRRPGGGQYVVVPQPTPPGTDIAASTVRTWIGRLIRAQRICEPQPRIQACAVAPMLQRGYSLVDPQSFARKWPAELPEY